MLTDLHDKLVLKGDFDACEELIEKAVNGKRIRGVWYINLKKKHRNVTALNINILSGRIGYSVCCFVSSVVYCQLLDL